MESPGACILYIGDSEEDSSDKKEVHMVAGYGRKLSVRNYYRQLIPSHSFAQMLLAHFSLTFAHLISGLTYVSAQILSLENWLMDYVPKSQGGAGTFSAQINTPSIEPESGANYGILNDTFVGRSRQGRACYEKEGRWWVEWI